VIEKSNGGRLNAKAGRRTRLLYLYARCKFRSALTGFLLNSAPIEAWRTLNLLQK
jgi:hypothetical protein